MAREGGARESEQCGWSCWGKQLGGYQRGRMKLGDGGPGKRGGGAQMGRDMGLRWTHKLWAATIEAIAVQVALPITGHENATQLSIPSCVERVI